MSDAPSKSFDPTESVRTLSPTIFKESNMTLREHQDTDRHYIGDSLPVPSDSMVAGSSIVSSSGQLAFPARADHTHESKMVYGYFNGGQFTVAPGSVYISNLGYTGWGRNMLVSGQVIAIPFPGLYLIHAQINVNRNGGGTFSGEYNIVFTYNNGSAAKTVARGSNFDIPNNIVLEATDILISPNAPSANDNIQIAIQHNDTVNWTAAVDQIMVIRVAGITSI